MTMTLSQYWWKLPFSYLFLMAVYLEWYLKFYMLNKTCAMLILVSLRAKDKQETANYVTFIKCISDRINPFL